MAFRFPEGDWTRLLRRLEARDWRGVIVGPEGSGKTTLLEELAERLSFDPTLIRLRGDTRRPLAAALSCLPRSITARRAVLIDGAEQLGALDWQRFRRAARRAGALIMTSHHRGRLPTVLRTRTSPALLRDLVAELAPEHAATLVPELGALYHRHNGNLRLCFRELYDHVAGRDRIEALASPRSNEGSPAPARK